MAEKHTIFLLLGSNIHPRNQYIKNAIEFINRSIGNIVSVSSLYETEPWGFEAPVAFLNQVVCVKSALEPLEILQKTQQGERQSGRISKTKRGYLSRTLDIDILFIDEEIIRLPELTVPHAQISNRRFTLIPLSEIAPKWEHPVFKKTCREMLEACTDTGKVWKFKNKVTYAL